MKRKMIAVFLAVVLVLPVTAQAVEPRIPTCNLIISYDEQIATCTVSIIADNMSDRIDAYIKFWYGTTEIESWTVSANGYLDFSGIASVNYGRTYRLTVDYWVNGQQQESAKTVKTCTRPA